MFYQVSDSLVAVPILISYHSSCDKLNTKRLEVALYVAYCVWESIV